MDNVEEVIESGEIQKQREQLRLPHTEEGVSGRGLLGALSYLYGGEMGKDHRSSNRYHHCL